MGNKIDQYFSKDEQTRYSRHFELPQFGPEAQRKLKNSKVIVVGAGGLGSPVLLYLAAAGIGSLKIIDNDQVTLSNLQRQVLFTTQDLNQPKAEIAAKRIKGLNPTIEIESIGERVTVSNALSLLSDGDVVVDCTDNFPTRYLLNDAWV